MSIKKIVQKRLVKKIFFFFLFFIFWHYGIITKWVANWRVGSLETSRNFHCWQPAPWLRPWLTNLQATQQSCPFIFCNSIILWQSYLSIFSICSLSTINYEMQARSNNYKSCRCLNYLSTHKHDNRIKILDTLCTSQQSNQCARYALRSLSDTQPQVIVVSFAWNI